MFPGSQLQIRDIRPIPGDCLICAAFPALSLNRINVTQAEFFCNHTTPLSKPHFRPSKKYKIINLASCIFLLIGIANNIQQMRGPLTTKTLVLVGECLISMGTIIVNLSCYSQNALKNRESHGLITLLGKKTNFGVREMLTAKAARNIYHSLLLIVIVFVGEEAITICRTLIQEEINSERLTRMVSVEIIIVFNVSIALYAMQFLFVYDSLFQRCYEEIEQTLIGDNAPSVAGALQKLQRFYMGLRRNFKLNETFTSPAILVIYSIDVCLLLICYTYVTVLYVEEKLELSILDWLVIIKSSGLVVAFCLCCNEAQHILIMNEEIVSTVFKACTSKLSPVEAAQIEMLVQTLTVLKPSLDVTNMYSIRKGLLATISGTVLTYTLVALQFHSLLKK